MEHSSTASAITPLKHLYGQTTASTMVDRAQSYLSQSTMIGTPVEFTGSQVDEFSASFDIFSDVSPQKEEKKTYHESKLVVRPVISKAKSVSKDFASKCRQPRAQPLPLLETRQAQITEFFKSTRNLKYTHQQEQALLKKPVAEKVYKNDKISFYFRSYSNNNEW